MTAPAPDPRETARPPGADASGAEAAERLLARGDLAGVEFRVIDALGIARGKWAPPDALPKAYREGVAFPLSLLGLDRWGREVAATGLHIESGDRDGLYRPVGPPRLLAGAARPTALAQLSGFRTDGAPHPSDPRHALVAAIGRLDARGLAPVMAFELEFHLFEPDTVPPVPARAADTPPGVSDQAMYSDRALRAHRAVWDDARREANAAGLPIDTIVSEAGPGQFEINLHHAPALDAADHAVALRGLVGGVARAHGLRASFMAKPVADEAGNGCHVHCSLLDEGGANAFARDEALLRRAIGGLLRAMPASTLALIGSWNGFRRMAPGSYAPTRAVWSENNRSVAVRVPAAAPPARRFEHRLASADACPYTVAALVLQGALEGIEGAVEPPPPAEGNAYEGTGDALPTGARAALAAHRASPFPARALGAPLADHLAHMLEAEFAAMERAIPPWEHGTYL